MTPTHTIYGPDGRPVRRWRVTRGDLVRIIRTDGTSFAVPGGAEMIEELPLDEWKPCVPPPCPVARNVTWEMDLTDAGRYVLGLAPHLSAAQRHGAIEL